VPSGDPYAIESDAVSPLSDAQRADLRKVVQRARASAGYGFSVYVGPLPEGRVSAIAQHLSLPDAGSAVLVAVDPSGKVIEIVTGVNAYTTLDDRACEFAALAMKSCFLNDDLVGGIREGINLLADHARSPRVLHLDES
jgi:hypothetical protein